LRFAGAELADSAQQTGSSTANVVVDFVDVTSSSLITALGGVLVISEGVRVTIAGTFFIWRFQAELFLNY
jgi:hypothetical protein